MMLLHARILKAKSLPQRNLEWIQGGRAYAKSSGLIRAWTNLRGHCCGRYWKDTNMCLLGIKESLAVVWSENTPSTRKDLYPVKQLLDDCPIGRKLK
jgi:hypothetical protein